VAVGGEGQDGKSIMQKERKKLCEQRCGCSMTLFTCFFNIESYRVGEATSLLFHPRVLGMEPFFFGNAPDVHFLFLQRTSIH
jgi:hypothetical protein